MKNKAKMLVERDFKEGYFIVNIVKRSTIFNPKISRIEKQFHLVIWDGNCKSP